MLSSQSRTRVLLNVQLNGLRHAIPQVQLKGRLQSCANESAMHSTNFWYAVHVSSQKPNMFSTCLLGEKFCSYSARHESHETVHFSNPRRYRFFGTGCSERPERRNKIFGIDRMTAEQRKAALHRTTLVGFLSLLQKGAHCRLGSRSDH